MLYPIVLAGGSGTRLWPMSRTALPKQFIEFFPQQDSLFGATLQRLQALSDLAAPIVVCNGEHRFLIAEELRKREQNEGRILLEPVGRNTAPAIAMAALLALEQDSDAMLLVLPADHVIKQSTVFCRAVEQAIHLAADNRLVTFGIVPGSPETGYGYIQQGAEIPDTKAFEVLRFVEKPDQATAESYLDAGGYLWNSGMFLFSAQHFLDELGVHAADILSSCEAAFKQLSIDGDFHRIPAAEFAACRSDSIDYAVMEKTARAAMIPLDAGWNDLGAWDAIWDHNDKDQQGNVIHGDVLTAESSDSYIHSNSRLVAAMGLKNTVIVETPDSVLVADKSRVQNIRAIVEQLQQAERKEADFHALVYRPWGSFEALAQGAGYQLKRIIVNPGAAISLQRHQQRSEHWTVVKGEALVHCDGKEFALHKNESTFIPLGSVHRLSNPGTTPVEIIEVQVGDYLGEDDIERLEDLYGR